MKYKRLARSMEMKKRILVISGPSGVGKGPIIDNVKIRWEEYGWGKLKQVKVRKTKTERQRKGADDIHFDGVGEYISIDCRGTEQRIYTGEIDDAIRLGERSPYERVIIEAYHTALDPLKERYSKYDELDFYSLFISPLDYSELEDLKDSGRLEEYLPDLMLDSLVRRSNREGKTFTRKLINELEKRAVDSLEEIKQAHKYDFVIANHCYESDSRWGMPDIDGSPNLVGGPFDVVDSICLLLADGKDKRADRGSLYKL